MSDKDEIFDYVMNTPDNTNPAILRGMLDDLNGSDLPPVTADDKDKFLHTNASTGNLEWAAGGGAFTVTISADPDNEGEYITDKTYAETLAAYQSGQLIVFEYAERRELAVYSQTTDQFVAMLVFYSPGIAMLGIPESVGSSQISFGYDAEEEKDVLTITTHAHNFSGGK